MNQEWVWAAVIIAAPLVVFGAVEMVSFMRRRRYQALARRPKHVRRPSAGTNPDQAA